MPQATAHDRELEHLQFLTLLSLRFHLISSRSTSDLVRSTSTCFKFDLVISNLLSQ